MFVILFYINFVFHVRPKLLPTCLNNYNVTVTGNCVHGRACETELLQVIYIQTCYEKYDKVYKFIHINTFTASYLNTQGLNNSCLK